MNKISNIKLVAKLNMTKTNHLLCKLKILQVISKIISHMYTTASHSSSVKTTNLSYTQTQL